MDHPRPSSNKRRRITRKPPAACTLPDDLVISEILPRLPAKCLMRFKSVCRVWRAAMAEPGFALRHREHHRLPRGVPPPVLVMPRKSSIDEEEEDEDELSEDVSFHRLRLGPPTSADAIEEEELMMKKSFVVNHSTHEQAAAMTNAIFPTHCDGLVAIATAGDQVFVCNPATHEFVALPPGTPDARESRTESASVAALGFNPHTKRYVVARYFYRRDDEDGTCVDIGHELFTLGGGGGDDDDDDSSWSWELTEDPPLPIVPSSPVCIGGALYWVSTNNKLLKFSLSDNKFAVIPLPPATSYHYTLASLTDLDGNLCYVHTASATVFDVWQLVDDGDGMSWSPRCRIDTLDEGLGFDAFLPVWAGEGRMLVAVDYEKLYWCYEKSGRLEEAVDLEVDVDLGREDGELYLHHVVPYVESLISIRSRE